MQYSWRTNKFEESVVLSCNEILARHSEYMDGEMAQADLERWRAHLADCALCARYDRVLRKGVRLLSATPPIEPDPSFTIHLRYRLADEERRATMRPVTMSAAVSVSVAAMLALAAWLPIVVIARGEQQTTAAAPASADFGFTASEIAWHGGAGVRGQHAHARPDVTLQHTTPAVSLMERRYTPLVLQAPTAPPSYTAVSLTSLEAR